ncbi:hypothetical protein SEVIR_4G011203v4 [Setaria viridis]|uniref:Protein kinase domain-containing protein n=1 Tax=Setaria viridis TaxID=4556 RepID=A0A4U6UV08_SETVI|nr:hypothetical protein SEVIR_4G011203v2 [Setaria viridis]
MASNQEDSRLALEKALHDESVEPSFVPLSLLEDITGNFSEDAKIGRGGFATVYKGRLGNGTVAVKRLEKIKREDFKFQDNELSCMIKAKHTNIVRLLGYCCVAEKERVPVPGPGWSWEDANRQLLLCSEYLPNGSLDRYIKGRINHVRITKFTSCKSSFVNYSTIDIYMLHILRRQILQIPMELHELFCSGYMAPEVYTFGANNRDRRLMISREADRYSLGVIIMDLLVGRDKTKDFLRNKQGGRYKVDEVLQIWEGAFKTLAEEHRILVRQQVKLCAEIAMECMDMDPRDETTGASVSEERRTPEQRPTASQITRRLAEMEQSNWAALEKLCLVGPTPTESEALAALDI